MENPFDNPTTIRTPENFVGREEQLKRIFGLIKNRQNISLVGPKRIGKTSLLTCLRNTSIQQRFHFAGNGFQFLYLDLQRRSMKTHCDFFDDLILALREQSQGYSAEDSFGKDDEFIALLNGFQQRGLHPVLMIDTFDEIARYEELDANVFSVLRSQGNSGQISYITTSVEPLGKIFNRLLVVDSMVSPFDNIFSIIRLRPFSHEEAAFLLMGFSQREGLPFTEQEVQWVLEMAGYHPYLLQQVAAVLFEEKRARGSEAISFSLVRKETQQNLLSHFEDCWHMLNANERQCLLEEVQRQDAGESAYPELSSSALFRDYLQATGELKAKGSVDISISDFTKILDKFDDPKVLGESALITIPYIAAQISQQRAVLPTARGKIVQKVVKEALESIGGQEKRSDNAPDWLDYNILYYILKYDMKRNVIAGRLGMSDRHLYRLLPRAVDRLLGAMLTLEESREPDSVI
jgi:hypothetical protein